jgi:hypothetical protein
MSLHLSRTKKSLVIAFGTSVALSFSAIGEAAHAAPATALTWTSTTSLQGSVVIPVGQSVNVVANTTIHVKNGTKITVLGSLVAPAGLTLTGSSWVGVSVVGSATLTRFNEGGAQTPFRVGAAGTLTIHGGNISGILGSSDVEGQLFADGITYDKGSGGGINSSNGTGSIIIDKSLLKGAGRDTGDFFGLYNAKSITLTNSQMTGAHCAFHVLNLTNMKLDHDSIHGNSYGFMMYGSGDAGTKTITNTSITNNLFGFDEGSASTHNGAISISSSYIKKNNRDLGLYTGKVTITSPLATSPA